MKKTKSFNLFTIKIDEFSIFIYITIKQNGSIRAKNSIKYSSKINKKIENLKNKKRRKEYNKKYNKNNKEKRKKYLLKNRHKINNRMKIYRKNNPEKIKMINRNVKNKRKGWGKIKALNISFQDSEFHHTHINNNHNEGLHIPAKLHHSIWHSYKNQESMDNINKLAFKWWEDEKSKK